MVFGIEKLGGRWFYNTAISWAESKGRKVKRVYDYLDVTKALYSWPGIELEEVIEFSKTYWKGDNLTAVVEFGTKLTELKKQYRDREAQLKKHQQIVTS
jgi:hypothetical protein